MHSTLAHRRCRYTLKTLMVALTGFAGACAALRYWTRCFEREREAARQVEVLGGTVDRSFTPRRLQWCLSRIDLARGTLVPERRVKGWSLLRSPGLDQHKAVSDRDLNYIAGCCALVELSLRGCSITDSGIKVLEVVDTLERLDLSSTAVSDVGMKSLVKLNRLIELDLSSTLITDAGVRRLAKLPNLRCLKLNACAITDACVSDLRAIARLEQLEVVDSQLTQAGVADIQRCLPSLDIALDRQAFLEQHGSF